MRRAPAALLPVLVLAACGTSDAGADDRADPASGSGVSEAAEPPDVVPAGLGEAGLAFDFEQGAFGLDAIVPSVEQIGPWPLVARVVTAAGGRVRRTTGPGDTFALQMPPIGTAGAGGGAVVVVTPDQGQTDEVDVLSPLERDFTFGLDFRLDEVSVGDATADSGDSGDNGDNLMQRGLFADDAQFKLQVDKGVPSCLVTGDAGSALVKASAPVERSQWYRVACTRSGDDLTLELSRIDEAGVPALPVDTWTVQAASGVVRAPSATVPLSVGGKVGPDGVIPASSSDQFNGALDNVRLEIAD